MCANSKATLQKNALEEKSGFTTTLPAHKLSLFLESPHLLLLPLILPHLPLHRSNRDMLSTTLLLSSISHMPTLCFPRTVYPLLTLWESHRHLQAHTIRQGPPTQC